MLFTPDPAFVGVASFDYTIVDDANSSISLATARFVVQPLNPVNTLSSAGSSGSTAAWVDVNRDGNLDAAIGSSIYLSDGSGNFSGGTFSLGLPVLQTPQFGDFNRDGYLDVVGIASSHPVIYYYNSGTGNYSLAAATIDTVGFTEVDYVNTADFDNDGSLDLVISGYATSSGVAYQSTRFLKNDGAGHFSFNGSADVLITSASFADADGDGDLDMLANTPISGPLYFRNGGGRFVAAGNPSSNTSGTVSTWGDYDGDGLPDFAASGINPQVGNEIAIYHNNGNGTFMRAAAIAEGTSNESDLQWADVDSDGDLDFTYAIPGQRIIYLNEGGGFRSVNATDVPVLEQIRSFTGPIAWGDYDHDGELDVLGNSSVVRNYANATTSRPTAPTNLTVMTGTGNTVSFSWDASSDDNTTPTGLTYTIRIGTTPGGNDVFSASALADGTRMVSAPGTYSKPFANVSLTSGRTYYWSVQAVDATLRGSAFASSSFYFNHPPQIRFGGESFTNEDTTLKLKASAFLTDVTDEDSGDSIQSIRIDSLPTAGTLLYQGETVSIGQEIPVTGPEYNAADWLVYVPDANVGMVLDPTDTILYAVSDGTEYGNTGTFNIYVNPVADTPYLTVSNLTPVPVGVPTPFPITAGTPDTDGSETVSIIISGLRAKANLTAGVQSGNTWILTPADLVNLQIVAFTPMPTSFDVTVTVSTLENGTFYPASVSSIITVTTVAPVITAINVPATGMEGTAIQMSATASDTSGTGLTYTWTLIPPFEAPFTLTGANVSFTPPDNGPCRVQLTVTDGLGASAVSTRFIDIRNVAPAFTGVANDGPVLEGSPVTITANATDVAGIYDPLSFMFDFDNNGFFETSAPSHTFSTAGTYVVGVQVDDGDGGYDTTTTTITVTHAPPTSPTDVNLAANSVLEGTANGTAVGLTAASTQPNGLTVTYSLTNDASGRFAINPITGVVTVANAMMLNFETATSHTITVQADDGQGGKATADFVIAITNAIPTMPMDSDSALNTVVEGAADGTTVGVRASASDVNGPGAIYSLTDDAGGRFAINSATGVVTVANGSLLNYEAATSHTITVQASDGAGGTSTQTFIINITNANETPTDISLSANTVAENLPSGTVIGALGSADPDASDTFTYTLVTGPGSSDNNSFAIDAAGNLTTAASFNFESRPSYSIRVRTTDAGGLVFEKAFTIGVIDVNEPPTEPSVNGVYSIREGDSLTLTATASDPEGDSLSYTWDVNGDGIFGDAFGASTTLDWNQLNALSPAINDSGVFNNVRVRVSDGLNPAIPSVATTLIVNNVAPTATLSNSGPVNEGLAAAVTFSNPFDLSSADSSAGFHYAYDFGDDGTIDVGGLTYAAAVTTASQSVPTLDINRVVRGYVIDKDDGMTSYLTTIVVNDLPPTVVIGSPSATLTSGGPVTYSVTVTDVNFDGSSLDASDFHLYTTGGDATGSVSLTGTGTSRTLTISNITGDGTLGIRLPAGSIMDVGGNTNTTDLDGALFTVDSTKPTTALVTAPSTINFASGGTNTNTITITYSDTGSGVDTTTFAKSNITVSHGATVTGISAVGNVVTYTITAPQATWARSQQGMYTISLVGEIQDLAGNTVAAHASFASFLVNTSLPTVAGMSPAVGPLSGGTLITVTGTGFTAGSAVMFGSTAGTVVKVTSSTSITVMSPAGTSGAVNVTVVTEAGTSTTSGRFTYVSSTAPSPISISRATPTGAITNASSVVFTITFSKQVRNVTAGSFALTGTAKGGKIGTPITADGGLTWSIPVTGLAARDGTLELDLVKNPTKGAPPIADLLDNPLATGTLMGQAYTLDHAAPSAKSIIGITPPIIIFTPSTVITYLVTFNEPVQNVTVGNFTLNGTAGGTIATPISLNDGKTWTVSVTGMRTSGTLELDLTSNAGITDLAGNGLLTESLKGQAYVWVATNPGH